MTGFLSMTGRFNPKVNAWCAERARWGDGLRQPAYVGTGFKGFGELALPSPHFLLLGFYVDLSDEVTACELVELGFDYRITGA